ncbi:metalloprotease TIKI1-like [Salvelinus fontinalis]|uniref:metalloprotease TIKI1-like n=1 Tax=Salvelinus fontinalis TaxID=8038 RepID=UPI002484FCCD|nr:metalloprotease TIKI1-like [Salvelinus fontinalis]
MLVYWVTFIQAFLILLVKGADQWSLRESSNCELNKKQSDLNSFLWTIKRNPPSYFYGTIHVPYTRVWDFIPENSKKAFQESNMVYLELDLTDPYTISALTSCQLLPQGGTLQDVLPRDIYGRLKRHLEYVKLMMPSWMTPDQRGKGLYADYLFNAIAGNWERKRPVWVMLMVNSLTEADIKTRGVPVLDLYLAQEAERMRKRTGAVEKVEEQCHPLNGLNFSQVIFALNQTLVQQESVRAGILQGSYTTEDLIKHYNCGDLNSIIFNHDTSQVPNFNNVTLRPSEQITAQEIDSYFRQELIYKRNDRMGNRVKALMEEHPDNSFFFAFGAEPLVPPGSTVAVRQSPWFPLALTPVCQSPWFPLALTPVCQSPPGSPWLHGGCPPEPLVPPGSPWFPLALTPVCQSPLVPPGFNPWLHGGCPPEPPWFPLALTPVCQSPLVPPGFNPCRPEPPWFPLALTPVCQSPLSPLVPPGFNPWLHGGCPPEPPWFPLALTPVRQSPLVPPGSPRFPLALTPGSTVAVQSPLVPPGVNPWLHGGCLPEPSVPPDFNPCLPEPPVPPGVNPCLPEPPVPPGVNPWLHGGWQKGK